MRTTKLYNKKSEWWEWLIFIAAYVGFMGAAVLVAALSSMS